MTPGALRPTAHDFAAVAWTSRPMIHESPRCVKTLGLPHLSLACPTFRTVFVLVLRETVLVRILEAAAWIRVRVPSCGLSTSTKVAETNFRRKSWVTPGALRLTF